MKLCVSSDLAYTFQSDTHAIISIQAALAPDQKIMSESLHVEPEADLVFDAPDERGERRFRACFSGDVRIRYEAIVDNGLRQELTPTTHRHTWSELPQHALPFLMPSRYCPSDKFMSFAQRQFGHIDQGGEAVIAVLEWLSAHIDYVSGASHSGTTAEDTFVQRAGVCRDFTHLGISLCRALSIPARAVSAYALDLDPPDFHAVFEVYLDGGWWLVDPTGMVPVKNLVRIGIGRDAADIAFLSTSSGCELIEQTVRVVTQS